MFVAVLGVGVADASVARVDVLVELDVELLVLLDVPELDVLELLDVVESELPPPPHAARPMPSAATRIPTIVRIVLSRSLDVVGVEPLRECLRQVCAAGIRPHVPSGLDDEP